MKTSYAMKAAARAEKVEFENMLNTMTDAALLEYCLCHNHTGKMEGMHSISTAVTVNPLCPARRAAALKALEDAKAKGIDIPEHICLSCFAEAQLEYQSSTDIKYRRAFEILNYKVYDLEDFPVLNLLVFRIESFGDVASVTQARNYIRLVKRNPMTICTAWTKNPGIWKEAFKIEGKPENMIMIYSNPIVDSAIDEKAFFAALKVSFPFLDKMFSVFTLEDETTNCGGRHCLTCLNCYRKDGPVFIHEVKK